MSRTFTRLIRFVSKDGASLYGEPILPPGVKDMARARQARVINGDVLGKYEVTEQIADVDRLLCPLTPAQVRTVRCLGLNYVDHAKETGAAIPKNPVLFYKPVTALTGPASPIPVPLAAQDPPEIDYECELVIVIKKRARDVTPETALDYVLGYTVGNDVSHREWQMKRGGGQWSLGKCFDGWAPLGPGIVTSAALPPGKGPQDLRISTVLNGHRVQDASTNDMIFSVAETVSFLSRGTTLEPGNLIFTGTPKGVGVSRKPQLWLKHGDIVEVSIDEIGTCKNKVHFEKDKARM